MESSIRNCDTQLGLEVGVQGHHHVGKAASSRWSYSLRGKKWSILKRKVIIFVSECKGFLGGCILNDEIFSERFYFCNQVWAAFTRKQVIGDLGN